MHCPFLIGERVYLRPIERDDAPRIVPWLNNQQVAQYLRWHKPLGLRTEEEFIDALYRPNAAITALGIVLKDGDRLIGVIGFQDVDERCRNASVGITIGEAEEWSKGYGTEALGLLVAYLFDTLNLHRVWLHVREDNLRGLRS
jgi:RimJ/RimL family protein N-acetyltransferase